MHLLSLLCGCMIPILFALVVLISEFNKLWLSWDGRYVGKPWITVWRAERAYKRGDIATYKRLVWGETYRGMPRPEDE